MKRILCMILSMGILIGAIGLWSTPVSAASGHTYSENLVGLIKDFEGFSAKAFWDYKQWSIGYGTVSSQGQTITKEAAETALRNELDKLDARVNEFASRYNLNLQQYQHDALVSFSFNCGTEWMNQSGRLRSAIVNGAEEAQLLFAFSLWANANSIPEPGLLIRRMAEANLYRNGVYAKGMPAAYSYVILDANGGTPGNGGEDKMQGYNISAGTEILAADPTKSGSTFGGWFTAPSGGTGVTVLTGAVARKTLYAQWGSPVTVTTEYTNVRSGAGTGYGIVGKRNQGETLVIVETKQVGNAAWGRFVDGWVYLGNTDYTASAAQPEQPDAVGGTVVCSTSVNIRSGAGTNYAVVGQAKNGTRVSVTKTATVNGAQWGYIGSGWMALQYVRLDSAQEPAPAPDNSSYEVGTVIGSNVNIRNAAGLTGRVVGAAQKGQTLKIYEQTTVSGTPWGRTDAGWICMNYVNLNSQTQQPETKDEVLYTGTVNVQGSLTVRSGAGTGNAAVRFLSSGTKVSVYEEKTVSGQPWGRIDEKNWVCLTYVKREDTAQTGITGTVSSQTELNIRSTAGITGTVVGAYQPGTTVTILETRTVSGTPWGRTASGWVCLDYVQTNSITWN